MSFLLFLAFTAILPVQLYLQLLYWILYLVFELVLKVLRSEPSKFVPELIVQLNIEDLLRLVSRDEVKSLDGSYVYLKTRPVSGY